MIIGVGIDTVEIERFAQWHTYQEAQLRRIFSSEEIAYCREHISTSAQRFAARFAAREAFIKALHQAYPGKIYNFLHICKQVRIYHNSSGVPFFEVTWPHIIETFPTPLIHLSMTHTKLMASSVVIFSSAL